MYRQNYCYKKCYAIAQTETVQSVCLSSSLWMGAGVIELVKYLKYSHLLSIKNKHE